MNVAELSVKEELRGEGFKPGVAANQLKHVCRYQNHGAFGEELPTCLKCGERFTCGPFEHGCINTACEEGKKNARPCLKCRKEEIYCCC